MLAYIQKIVASIIGEESSSSITTEFSFADDKRMDEDAFFMMLEIMEKEMRIDLMNQAWRFETVNDLAKYMMKHK